MGNMIYVEGRWKKVLYLASAIIFFSFLIVALIVGNYNPRLELLTKGTPAPIVPIDTGTKPGSSMMMDNIIALGILLALVPVSLVGYFNNRYVRSVEINIPRFLRDILQGTDSGLILPKALLEASKMDYGPVSYQMGIAMTKFSMGYDFSKSIMEACKAMRHPFAPQVGQIIAEAYAAGGKTHEVLSSSVTLFNDLEQYDELRRSELRPYPQLIYISIGVYLIIAIIVVHNFVDPYITAVQTQVVSSSSAGALNGLHLKIPAGGKSYFMSIFYLSAVLESVFGGLVIGKIVDRSALSGLKHSAILIAITIIAFSLLGLMLGYKLLP